MAVESIRADTDNVLKISVTGDFNLSVHKDFRAAYDGFDYHDYTVFLDLACANTMDSSALGMILVMQADLEKEDDQIHIINANDDIKKILKVAHFDSLFIID